MLGSLSLTLLVVACVLSVVRAETSAFPPTIDLGYASYQGVFNSTSNITSFNGIRYAAPPTDELRWAAPQAPSTTVGVQLANTPPPACLQGIEGASLAAPTSLSQYKRSVIARQTPATSEDCLFLSVSIPGTHTGSKLPVVVWIHGGGYDVGYEAMYDQTDLVVEGQGGVVAIAIQYRLGIFGFLAGKEVKEGGGVLNAGLIDQEFALQWVQKYVHLFGGDPESVTIWGESAGAGSVLQLIVAHGGQTSPALFRSAITSSTYLPPQFEYDAVVPQALFDATAAGTNCTSSEPSAALSCLRAVDASTLNAVNVNISASGLFGTFVFVPVVDGKYILQSPVKLLAEGKVNGKNLLSVTNTFEGLIFVSNLTGNNTDTYIKELWPSISPAQAKKGATLYQSVSSDPISRAIGIYGESIIICPTYWLLSPFAGRSWKGEFAIVPGAHGEDILYYFQGFHLTGAGIPGMPIFNSSIFAQSFAQSFLSFAINQSPNAKINTSTLTPHWDIYSEGEVEMLFNSTDGVAADSQPVVKPVKTDEGLLERCAFWKEISGAA